MPSNRTHRADRPAAAPTGADPLDTILRQLARCADPLVRRWAARLLRRGERADFAGTNRPRPAMRKEGAR